MTTKPRMKSASGIRGVRRPIRKASAQTAIQARTNNPTRLVNPSLAMTDRNLAAAAATSSTGP